MLFMSRCSSASPFLPLFPLSTLGLSLSSPALPLPSSPSLTIASACFSLNPRMVLIIIFKRTLALRLSGSIFGSISTVRKAGFHNAVSRPCQGESSLSTNTTLRGALLLTVVEKWDFPPIFGGFTASAFNLNLSTLRTLSAPYVPHCSSAPVKKAACLAAFSRVALHTTNCKEFIEGGGGFGDDWDSLPFPPPNSLLISTPPSLSRTRPLRTQASLTHPLK
mmetsp:Transcript_17821/g.32559  ORF Transcript_17821/g.32559 Transcript_17821/m.32559 type:complete len:221 (-) Transcript_17821:1834-2496(-)